MIVALALAASPPPGLGSPAPAPFVGPSDWLHGVWGDGGVLAVQDLFGVRAICRSGQVVPMSTPKYEHLEALGGGGPAGAPVIAAVGEAGAVLVWGGARPGFERAPVIEAEGLVGVTVDAAGRIYAAGERHAVYVRDGAVWAVHRYPGATAPAVRAIAALGPGRVLMVGEEGLVLTYRDGVVRRLNLPTGALTGDLKALWVSPSGSAWIVGDGSLARLDVQRGAVISVPIPLSGPAAAAITGVATPQGDVVVVGGMNDLALYDGERFLRIPGEYSFPEGLHLDGHEGALYVAHRDGLRRIGLRHPGLDAARAASGAAPPCPLGDRGYFPEYRSERTGYRGQGDPVEPVAVDEVIVPKPRGTIPTLRLALGPAIEGRAGGGATSTLTLDLLLGATVGVRPRVAVWPEFGYSFQRPSASGGHFFTAGVGPLFGGKFAGVAVMPRLVVGSAGGALAMGMRTSVIGTFALDMLAIEAGHQWLWAEGASLHEARVTFSLNVAPLLAVLAIAAVARRLMR